MSQLDALTLGSHGDAKGDDGSGRRCLPYLPARRLDAPYPRERGDNPPWKQPSFSETPIPLPRPFIPSPVPSKNLPVVDTSSLVRAETPEHMQPSPFLAVPEIYLPSLSVATQAVDESTVRPPTLDFLQPGWCRPGLSAATNGISDPSIRKARGLKISDLEFWAPSPLTTSSLSDPVKPAPAMRLPKDVHRFGVQHERAPAYPTHGITVHWKLE